MYRAIFENVELIEFSNGYTARNFIGREIINSHKIDLILTDINHPGPKGNELVQYRKLESELCRNRKIPIIIVSMIDVAHFTELVSNNSFDYYLSKAT